LNPQREPQLLAGIVYAVRMQVTRRGRMAVVVLDDGSAQVELVVYSELFESARSWLKEDQLLIVEAKVNNRGGDDEYGNGLRIIADQLYNLETARSRYAKYVELHCNGKSNAARLKELLAPHRADTQAGNVGKAKSDNNWSCPVLVFYRNQDAACKLELGDAWRISPEENLLESLRAHFNEENVRVVY
jgi:DNA polymerase-3 subunit alpha